MLRWTLPLLFVATVAVQARAQEGIVDISKRRYCDKRLYHDFETPLSAVADSAALLEQLLPDRGPDKATSFMLTFGPDGSLQRVQQQPWRQPARTDDALRTRLAPAVHWPSSASDSFTVALAYLPGSSPPQLLLGPVDLTCQPFALDPKQTLKTFTDGIAALRRQRTPVPKAGRVAVLFVVGADSTIFAETIESSSGSPAVDSVALLAIRHARYAPAVLGRRTTNLWTIQALVF